MAEFEPIRKIEETRTLNVTCVGSGLGLYLPKDLVDTYGISPVDRIKVTLSEIYRERVPVEGVKAHE